MRENFKLIPYNKNQDLDSNLFLVLLTPIYSSVFQVTDCKKDLVIAHNFRHSKRVFTMLNKIITVYMRLIFINIGSQSLKSLFLGSSKFFGIEIEGFSSKTVFKICYRFYLKYFGIKLITRLEFQEIKSASRLGRSKGFFISLFLLHILALVLNRSEGVTKPLFFLKISAISGDRKHIVIGGCNNLKTIIQINWLIYLV